MPLMPLMPLIPFKKINRMPLIRTLMVSTIAFEGKKDELHGFRQTEKVYGTQNIGGCAIRISHTIIIKNMYLWYKEDVK